MNLPYAFTIDILIIYKYYRLLNPLTEWTKCVFTITAEAVEAENLFFLLGGPTSSTST